MLFNILYFELFRLKYILVCICKTTGSNFERVKSIGNSKDMNLEFRMDGTESLSNQNLNSKSCSESFTIAFLLQIHHVSKVVRDSLSALLFMSVAVLKQWSQNL